jgi:hypothetical protein
MPRKSNCMSLRRYGRRVRARLERSAGGQRARRRAHRKMGRPVGVVRVEEKPPEKVAETLGFRGAESAIEAPV